MIYLYHLFFKKYPNLVKIGISTNVLNRIKTLETVHGKIDFVKVFTTKNSKTAEKSLHVILNNYNVKLLGDGGTEFFKKEVLETEDYKLLKTLFNLNEIVYIDKKPASKNTKNKQVIDTTVTLPIYRCEEQNTNQLHNFFILIDKFISNLNLCLYTNNCKLIFNNSCKLFIQLELDNLYLFCYRQKGFGYFLSPFKTLCFEGENIIFNLYNQEDYNFLIDSFFNKFYKRYHYEYVHKDLLKNKMLEFYSYLNFNKSLIN